jgi:hypothetical protein
MYRFHRLDVQQDLFRAWCLMCAQRVEVSDTDFRAFVDLVRDSSKLLVKEYSTALRKS